MPEVLWKAYIDFEIEEGEREAARALYERLISLSGHVKVWISYATFEAEPIPLPRAERDEEEEDEDEEAERKMVAGDATLARALFERGYRDLKSKGLTDEVCDTLLLDLEQVTDVFLQRVALLEVWKTFEQNYGSEETVAKVQAMMPFPAKKQIEDPETGQMVEGTHPFPCASFEEQYLIKCDLKRVEWHLVFPDDEKEKNPTSFKFLQMAHAWKKQKEQAGTGKALSGFIAAAKKQDEEEDDSDDDDAKSSSAEDDD